ncbi:MAG: ribonuclease T2 [Hyphomicrobiales bacterium]
MRVIISLFAFVLACLPAAAQTPRADNTPGAFDYYVLALSWSPSYCEAEGEKADRRQCSSGRPYAFVVHGLWPQYERGWPEFCPSDDRWASRREIDAMLDIMPDRGLVIHQWKKHGTCSGLTQRGYFDRTRAAFGRINIPDEFRALENYRMTSPADIEKAFIDKNPGLAADMIAVTCDNRRLREVQICFDRQLGFRACPAVDRRACRNDRIAMPPVR